MDWDGNYIVDDELKTIFSKLPAGVHLDVLLDSCHSGTATRDIVEPAQHSAGGGSRLPKPRFLAPPVDILCRQLDEDDLPINRIMKPANSGSHALFSGCRENQTSADAYIKGNYNGAFTYYFCKHVRDSQGDLSRTELLKRLRASLRHEGYDQVPQLECPASWKKKKVLE